MSTYDLDLPCWSARDVLVLTNAVRGTKARDPLRAVEDLLLDMVNEG